MCFPVRSGYLSALLSVTLCVSVLQSSATGSATELQAPTAVNIGEGTSTPDLLREAFRLYAADNLAGAHELIKQVLERLSTAPDRWLEAEAHRGLGLVLSRKADYPAAHSELERALSLFESIPDRLGAARSTEGLAIVANMMGDPKKEHSLYLKAIAEYKNLNALRDTAQALLNLAYCSDVDAPEQQRLLHEALSSAIDLHAKRLEARALHALADRDFMRGEFSEAVLKLQRSAALLQQENARFELSRVWTSLGRIYRAHGQYREALNAYRQGADIQRQIGDTLGLIQNLNAMATASSFLKDKKQMLRHYRTALRLAQETHSPSIINFTYGNLAAAYIDLGLYARAARMLEETIRRETDPWRLRYRYTSLSEAYLNLGRNRLAAQTAGKALALTPTTDLEYRHRPLMQRAVAEQNLGKHAEALTDTEDAIDVIEQLRTKLVPSDFMKRGFGDQHQELFALAVALYHQLGRYQKALETGERARARAFLDLLATRATQAGAGVGSQQAEITTGSQDTIASLDKEPQPANSPVLEFRGTSASPLSIESQDTDIRVESMSAAKPFTPDKMADAASRLRSTLLSYWVTKEATYVWVLRPGAAPRGQYVKVNSGRLTELIRNTFASAGDQTVRGALRNGPATTGKARFQTLALRGGGSFITGETQRDSWRQLYDLLIRPVQSLLPTNRGSLLTIVPHGPLFLLSFAALEDEQGRYLVEKYRLHYVPAVSVLEFTDVQKRQSTDLHETLLLVGDPATVPLPDGRRLPRLQGARREIRLIKRLFPTEDVTLLEGAEAQEESVRRLASDKSVIHLSTHAIIRDDRPLDSFLAFAGTSVAGPNDGRLTVGEIYDMRLHANLVVLSACRTGLGKISGDGMIGLTRAFFYAGTLSLVVSLWDVADVPTVVLMSNFYRALRTMHDKAEALRAAQLKLIQALRDGKIEVNTQGEKLVLPENPVFWASFVLFGEP